MENSYNSGSSSERNEIIYGEENVVNQEVRFFSNSQSRIDTCMGYTGPALAAQIESIRRSFLEAKNRGVMLRYLTEITNANISYCKELISIVGELRHLDGIKGNFMISESEYLAPLVLFEHGKVAPQAVYSNFKEVVEQQQYIFDNFWNMGVPAGERIKEIEEGRTIHYETKVLRNQDEIVDKIKDLLETSDELLVCSSFGGLQLGYRRFLDSGKEVLARSRRREHKGTRLLTAAIRRNNIELLKILLNMGIQIREIKNMPPMNFAVTDKEVQATIDEMADGKMVQSVLVSNELIYVNHFRYIFEELWKDGIDAKTRMASIEEGVDLGNIEVLPSAPRARELYSKLLEDATEEVLLLFPSINEFRRQERIITESRVLPNAESKTTSELSIGIRNIRVRILMPFNRLIQQNIQDFKSGFRNIEIRYIEPLMLTTQATILVTDRKNSLVMEIRDDSKSTFDEAIGMSTYSDSKAGVLSYVSIFENLWKQIELYEDIVKSHEQLRIHDKMQQEFINVAAHELRTPIQPIIGLSQVLLSKTGNIEQYNGFLDIIYRNANRLTRLSDDILDVAKIESKSLGLKKVQFNLNDVIGNAMDDLVLSKDFNSKNLQLSYEPRDIFLQADKSRIAQVISNLLNNALKFTSEGTITISTEKYTANKKNKDWVIVNVKDTGQGIDSSVLSRLFKKFASKSDHGTGLGLFISKGIIEAHLGKICGKNNEDGKGATFSFRIPAT